MLCIEIDKEMTKDQSSAKREVPHLPIKCNPKDGLINLKVKWK